MESAISAAALDAAACLAVFPRLLSIGERQGEGKQGEGRQGEERLQGCPPVTITRAKDLSSRYLSSTSTGRRHPPSTHSTLPTPEQRVQIGGHVLHGHQLLRSQALQARAHVVDVAELVYGVQNLGKGESGRRGSRRGSDTQVRGLQSDPCWLCKDLWPYQAVIWCVDLPLGRSVTRATPSSARPPGPAPSDAAQQIAG